jgi:uncharacterized protein YyaL (SSP411 family)
MANQIFNKFSDDIIRYPVGYTYLLSAFDFAVGPSNEIIIFGEKNLDNTKKFLKIISNTYIPNSIVINIFNKSIFNSIIKLFPYLKNYKIIENKTTLYFCENYQCKKPITDTNILKEFLN